MFILDNIHVGGTFVDRKNIFFNWHKVLKDTIDDGHDSKNIEGCQGGREQKRFVYFSRHHWMIKASRRIPREVAKGKKTFLFWVLGTLGNDGDVKNGVKIHQRHQEGHPRTLERDIYIILVLLLFFNLFFLSNKLRVLKRMPWASRMMPRNYGKKISFLGKRR